MSDENTEKYPLGDHYLIQYQTLRAKIIRTVWQKVRTIASEIVGVKRLRDDFTGNLTCYKKPE